MFYKSATQKADSVLQTSGFELLKPNCISRLQSYYLAVTQIRHIFRA